MAKGQKGQVQRIDTAYFDTAISELNNALETFNSAIGNIQTQTARLQESWDGSGASKFDSAYKRLKQEFNDQSENLTAIRDDLQAILETYQDWDSETQSTIAENSMGNE